MIAQTIIDIIEEVGEIKGNALRELLADQRQILSFATFYSVMTRLEDLKKVEGFWREQVIDDEPVQFRWYRLVQA